MFGNYNLPYLLPLFQKVHIKVSIIAESWNNITKKLCSGTHFSSQCTLFKQEKNLNLRYTVWVTPYLVFSFHASTKKTRRASMLKKKLLYIKHLCNKNFYVLGFLSNSLLHKRTEIARSSPSNCKLTQFRLYQIFINFS